MAILSPGSLKPVHAGIQHYIALSSLLPEFCSQPVARKMLLWKQNWSCHCPSWNHSLVTSVLKRKSKVFSVVYEALHNDPVSLLLPFLYPFPAGAPPSPRVSTSPSTEPWPSSLQPRPSPTFLSDLLCVPASPSTSSAWHASQSDEKLVECVPSCESSCWRPGTGSLVSISPHWLVLKWVWTQPRIGSSFPVTDRFLKVTTVFAFLGRFLNFYRNLWIMT